MRHLYTVFFALCLPLVFLRLIGRSLAAPAYRHRWGERLGNAPRMPAAGTIWVHAVSVGETLAAAPLVEALLARYPDRPVMVTTTTPTGSERVRALFGQRVVHAYVPYDLPCLLRRFLRRVRPALLVIMETELWPNLVAVTAARGVPVMLANARLSASSARGYARFRPLTRSMLENLSAVAAQTGADGERFRALGLPASALHVTGNIKFDRSLDQATRDEARQLRRQWGASRPLWIAASTHPGEDAVVLAAHRRLREHWPSLGLILVPRHPERFDTVARQAREAGFRVSRRSEGAPEGDQADVILGDTMGELWLFYGVADVAFVGGSLVPVGGHNALEPATWAIPVVTGPAVHNFAAITAWLKDAGALRMVDDEAALVQSVAHWLEDDSARRAAGAAGEAVVEANRGALARQLAVVDSLLGV